MELRNELRREYPDAIPIDQQTIDPVTIAQSAPDKGPNQEQSIQSSAKPIAPTRHRRNKRGNDERSPPVLPASQYQKLTDEAMNTSYEVPTLKSPIKAAIAPPIADLFEIPAGQMAIRKSASKLPDDDVFALPTKTQPSCSTHVETDPNDHSIYIGLQHI